MPDTHTRFVFGGKNQILIGMVVLLSIFGCFGILSAIRGELDFLKAFLFFFLLFLSIFGLVLISRSDVVLTDQGISRCLWGWTWKAMSWENVQRIAEFPVSKGSRAEVRALNIFPKIKPSPRFTPSGKMFFTMDMNGLPEFIERMNGYISLHEIGLTVRDTPLGEPRTSTRLSA